MPYIAGIRGVNLRRKWFDNPQSLLYKQFTGASLDNPTTQNIGQQDSQFAP